ncbi:DUF763 domain-containing protein [Candidatus Bipolaricaulota bacterium]|nr:DUF763 domain-containing protein [Candidatus Bipolaricaulota bacterium]
MRTGTSDLPLHHGRAPRWLFQRMTRLAGSITELMVLEHGVDGLLSRISDPFWFQSLGCVLGFDWHSSGVTTTTCGAIKEGIKGKEEELGLFVAGGKGAASRETPAEIRAWGEKTGVDADMLVDASKTSAKVDSAAVQDGYQLYHHVFLFDRDSQWAVVQQGMNDDNGYARRYHWQSSSVDDFVNEPHAAICCDQRKSSLNLVAQSSESARETSTKLSKEKPVALIGELVKLKSLALPRRHEILMSDISPTRLDRVFLKTYEAQPETFKDLLCLPGVGAKTIRALSLIAELTYGTEPSYQDPARFGFAHGGKDGIPYPVDRPLYDQTIALMERAIRKAKLGHSEELQALRRMERYFGDPLTPIQRTAAGPQGSQRIRLFSDDD